MWKLSILLMGFYNQNTINDSEINIITIYLQWIFKGGLWKTCHDISSLCPLKFHFMSWNEAIFISFFSPGEIALKKLHCLAY